MWLNGPAMHTPRTELHPVRFRDKIIVIGGAKSAGKRKLTGSSNVEVFEVGAFSKVINEGTAPEGAVGEAEGGEEGSNAEDG